MEEDGVTLHNPHLMGIIHDDGRKSLAVIRSKDMIISSLDQELRACNMPRLRKIAHKVFGKGSWISISHKKVLIERLIKASEKGKAENILQLIAESKKDGDLDIGSLTPQIKKLCSLIAIEIARGVKRHLNNGGDESSV